MLGSNKSEMNGVPDPGAPGISNVFDYHAAEYDAWFGDHQKVYETELELVKSLLPSAGKGIEIGAGTGRFALPLGILEGVEPSEPMAAIARERGMHIIAGRAEAVPAPDGDYDYVTMIVTVCYVTDVDKAFREVLRILKPGGVFVVGFIDKDSDLGKVYQKKKLINKFYKDARFYSSAQISGHLQKAGFKNVSARQCLFLCDGVLETGHIQENYGTGGFVAFRAEKP